MLKLIFSVLVYVPRSLCAPAFYLFDPSRRHKIAIYLFRVKKMGGHGCYNNYNERKGGLGGTPRTSVIDCSPTEASYSCD